MQRILALMILIFLGVPYLALVLCWMAFDIPASILGRIVKKCKGWCDQLNHALGWDKLVAQGDSLTNGAGSNGDRR